MASRDFANRLILLMEKRGLTIRETAQIAGVPRSTLANWRSGHPPKNFIAVQKLAKHFGISFCRLLTGEEEALLSQPSFESILECDEEIFSGICEVKIRRLKLKSNLA